MTFVPIVSSLERRSIAQWDLPEELFGMPESEWIPMVLLGLFGLFVAVLVLLVSLVIGQARSRREQRRVASGSHGQDWWEKPRKR